MRVGPSDENDLTKRGETRAVCLGLLCEDMSVSSSQEENLSLETATAGPLLLAFTASQSV